MNIKNVPQDDSSTYAKMKKAIYASDEEGNIQSIGSSGWDVEEVVTQQAIDDLEEQQLEAYESVVKGEKSPLYYYMFEARMDLVVLSQSTGFFQWTIKKDFKPEVFKTISDKRALIYCDALGKTIEALKKIPKARNE
jgi:hypothetical protein